MNASEDIDKHFEKNPIEVFHESHAKVLLDHAKLAIERKQGKHGKLIEIDRFGHINAVILAATACESAANNALLLADPHFDPTPFHAIKSFLDEGFRKKFTNITGFNVEQDFPEFDELKKAIAIRHQIVHRGGFPKVDDAARAVEVCISLVKFIDQWDDQKPKKHLHPRLIE